MVDREDISNKQSLQSDSLRFALGVLIYWCDLRCDAQGDKLIVRDAEDKTLKLPD
jgi:hypothetical protein